MGRRVQPRFGDPLAQQVPIRKLDTVQKRKALIGFEKYTDKYWDNTGNKRRFLRIQRLVRLVSKEGNIETVSEEGSDAEWNDAIVKFHAKWDIGQKPRALSTILKMN